VPKTGIIVATPYVDVGLDIDPARTILIDSGRMVAIDKGRKVKRNPPTDPARNKQRVGRVGRNKPGIVFQPKCAGTGVMPTQYPAGFMFEHEVISRVYDLPMLTPIPHSLETCPYVAIDHDKVRSRVERKSLFALHAISLAGERDVNFKRLYTKLLTKDRLGEEQWWLDRVMNDPSWATAEMLPWEEALTLLSIHDAVSYGLDNSTVCRGPIQPVHGVWHDSHLDDNTTIEPFIDKPESTITNEMKVDKIKSILTKLSQKLATTTNEAVSRNIIADVSRITASIIH